MDECATAETATRTLMFPGLDPKCGEKQLAAACGDTAPECLKGTLANDAVCDFSSQCVSGHCAKVAAVDKCGKCSAAKKEGDSCGATDFACGDGLRCDFVGGKCVKTIADGGDCSAPADSFGCAFGLTCLSDVKKCGKPRQIDAMCTPITGTISLDCRSGLDCKDQKCADIAPPFKGPGETCGLGDECKGKTACVVEKCAPFAKEGDACGANVNAPCDPYAGLTCTAGKCVVFEACK